MPYWRLSGFYLFYFASLGALVPYWGLYLKTQGYSAKDIGLFLALIMGTKIVSPNIWGWIADHTGKRMVIVRGGCLLAAISFAGIFIQGGYWWLVLVMVTFSFFWNATLPQFEVTTFNYLGSQIHRYSNIRLWGSIGFILSVASVGYVLERYGALILPTILILLFLGIWVMSLRVPEKAAKHLPIAKGSLLSIIKRPAVAALLVVCLLMQMSHGPYYTFYTLYLEVNGYSRSTIGQFWALGVIAEVLIFLVMFRLVPKFGLRRLLLISLVLAAIRWLVIAYCIDYFIIMLLAQILHAASFGIYHGCAIQFIHQQFVGNYQGRGQALYSSLSFGVGGALGSLYSGYSWDSLGSSWTFIIAAVISCLALIIGWKWVREEVH
jgi:PPP family 3-phenylpropionic acid transporter